MGSSFEAIIEDAKTLLPSSVDTDMLHSNIKSKKPIFFIAKQIMATVFKNINAAQNLGYFPSGTEISRAATTDVCTPNPTTEQDTMEPDVFEMIDSGIPCAGEYCFNLTDMNVLSQCEFETRINEIENQVKVCSNVFRHGEDLDLSSEKLELTALLALRKYESISAGDIINIFESGYQIEPIGSSTDREQQFRDLVKIADKKDVSDIEKQLIIELCHDDIQKLFTKLKRWTSYGKFTPTLPTSFTPERRFLRES